MKKQARKLPEDVRTVLTQYKKSNTLKASWQLINSLGSYILLWVIMYFTVQLSMLLTVLLSIIAGMLLIRIFIIFHDCAHGSFFTTPRLNVMFGRIISVFVFTPFEHWKWEHNVHHATSGKLDDRNVGDITTLTVAEYEGASSFKQFLYRIYRHPLTLFIIGSLFRFMIQQRFSSKTANTRRRGSIWATNIAILVLSLALISIYGLKNWAIIQLLTVAVASSIGVWLFYVQHQFEDAYWTEGDDWDFIDAAMLGSSYYKLPKVLQWLTGNIGFHHIHHLSPLIPNYHLENCHNNHDFFKTVKTFGIKESLQTIQLRLWDERQKKLIPFD